MDQKALGVICIFYFIKTVQKDKFELRNISFLSPNLHACFYGFFCFLFTYSICYPLHNGQWNEKQQTSKIFKYLTFWYYEIIFSKNSAKSDYSKKQDLKSTKRFESHSTQQNIFEYYYQPYYDYMDKQHDIWTVNFKRLQEVEFHSMRDLQ